MFSAEAYAKINWSLDITGQREDGYHLLDMVMQSVSLSDTLTVDASETLSLQVLPMENGGLPVPADEHNLVLRAARKLQELTGTRKGACMTLQKRVPSGAGLGGGSGDAAAALLMLNQLWGLCLTKNQLCEAGLALGADVPFMLTGGLARVTGIGEMVHPIPDGPEIELVLYQPQLELPTGGVFAAYDRDRIADDGKPDQERLCEALLHGNLLNADAHAVNVLEPVCRRHYPEIEEAAALLKQCSAPLVRMTGSGSVVFGAFSTPEAADTAARALALQGSARHVIRCKTLSHGCENKL